MVNRSTTATPVGAFGLAAGWLLARRALNQEIGVMAKSKKTNERTVTITDSDVARRAYELYLARGCEDGHDVDDWLQAERERR